MYLAHHELESVLIIIVINSNNKTLNLLAFQLIVLARSQREVLSNSSHQLAVDQILAAV